MSIQRQRVLAITLSVLIDEGFNTAVTDQQVDTLDRVANMSGPEVDLGNDEAVTDALIVTILELQDELDELIAKDALAPVS